MRAMGYRKTLLRQLILIERQDCYGSVRKQALHHTMVLVPRFMTPGIRPLSGCQEYGVL